ncbi:hypothetical protein ACLKA6_010040 [Drosophila palustris]
MSWLNAQSLGRCSLYANSLQEVLSYPTTPTIARGLLCLGLGLDQQVGRGNGSALAQLKLKPVVKAGSGAGAAA